MEDIWKSLREMEWDDIVPEEDVIQRPKVPGPYAGQKHTEEVKQRMRIPKTEEHKEKIRQAIKAKWAKGEYDRDAYRQRELGKVHSEDVKKRIGQTLKKTRYS